MLKRSTPALFTVLVLLGSFSAVGAQSAAASAGPGYTISAVSGPTIFSPEHNGGNPPDDYTLLVTNSGSEHTNGVPVTISDTLPFGLTAHKLIGYRQRPNSEGPIEFGPCDTTSVSCTYEGELRSGERLMVAVQVSVAPGTQGPVTDSATVAGGGAATASTNVTTAIGSAANSLTEPFGLAYFSQQVVGEDGLPDAQAGDHPFAQTLSFSLNTVDSTGKYASAGARYGEPAHAKDVVVDLPPGFIGDPEAVEKCPQYDLASESCPPGSQLGVARITIFSRGPNGVGGVQEYPIFNVVPDRGDVAEFVIDVGTVPVPLHARVGPETDYGIQVITPDIPEIGAPADVSVTFFGTPATNPSAYRVAPPSPGSTPVAFLDDPTNCSGGALETRLSVDSWEKPGSDLANGSPNLSDPNWASASTTVFSSLSGCELLQFDPAVTVTPDTTKADEPAGVAVDLKVPQAPQQFPALATPYLKATTVTLPAGLSLDPSAGDGLQGCSDAQFAASVGEPATCPSASQIGTVSAASPVLSEQLQGQVFLGSPNCDPCTNADASDGNMFRLFLQLQAQGILIKQEGKIYANTTTGQLTTVFPNLPEAPVSDVQLKFNGGLRAGLATPQSCGMFTTTTDFTPWSTPITPDATPESSFDIDWDGKGGACPATMPFAPSFSAGTSNPNAGQFSPFTLTFAREDREQDLSGIKVHMPPGLLGSLASIPLCAETQAELGTCALSSRVGTMTVAAGAGSHPFYTQGSIYLTGPYEGAPFGLSIVVPTVAGPFNLGNVVVRSKINIDPTTAALTVTSDPLPQILDGIPLRLRAANVTIERPGFIFNPTDCAQQAITATLSSAQGAQANVSAPFAVSGCAGLHFGPSFKVSTSGRTSRTNGASLDAKVVFPTGAQSNIRTVKVDLPKQLPSRLSTLQKACPAAQFERNPASCPTGSVIGVAKASTPLLPVQLTGPVYFVSHAGEEFPSLIVVLQGYGVRVDLTAATFISKTGITSSTFRSIPDVPVNSFELYLPEGKNSALAANVNLCAPKLLMPTLFTAQDGAQFKQSTKISVTGCPKAKTAKTARVLTEKAHRARNASHGNGGTR